MSQYKTAIGSPAVPVSGPDNNRYRTQARQLQELFPSWSNDGVYAFVQSLLHEVAGDVELAATRISEGHAEQWGAVTRKKDKKPNGLSHPPKESASTTRTDFRGGRGGARGGRGGSTRGGTVPRARGGVRTTNGQHHITSTDNPPAIDKSVEKPPATAAVVDNPWPEQAPTSSWTEPSESVSATPASWGNTKEPELNDTPKVSAKTPATSKMSWAQIARPQEKPVSVPAPPLPSTTPILEPEPKAHTDWEEPTTVQPPPWEEEAPTIKPSTSTSAADVWASAVTATDVEEPKQPESERLEQSQILPPAPTSHRNSARYKLSDQAVVMPSSFGTGLEKVGMQFGSLSLGSDASFEATPESDLAPEPQPSTTSPPVVTSVHHDPPPQATVPPSSASLGSALFQQSLPPQASHSLPSSISQPVVSQNQQKIDSQSSQELNQLTPQQQYMQQHMAAGGYVPPHVQQQQQQQQQQQPQQQQQQPHPQQTHTHQYSQHGLPTHLDPSQPAQQHQSGTGHSSYFRNDHTSAASTPYFHAATPPANQGPDTPYGAFGQLGVHQSQGGHLAGFGQDYGHDSPRGFYESYQPSGFNRGALSHDDVKGLSSASQTQPNTGGLPPPAPSTGQHGNGQNSGQQPPPNGGPQGQQYAPPVPYYYPYPQNQYYGAPYNSGYSVPPYVKYPAMFPGPPGPANGPAPNQQSQNTLKGQGQGLYQSGYDDYPGQPQPQPQPQQHSLSLTQDYGKPLYGGGQGFIGLSGPGAAAGPQANARGGSPETQYKPYGKDVGVAARVQPGQQQSQGQPQNSGQGQGVPPGQGFYGGNRFGGVGGSVGSGATGPQQSTHHQAAHLGYSQTQNEFYPYQGRQQQYWQ
ncbi:CUE domain-containing protein [Mycena indigotica]|uniref:RNA polymerase II degradation factor 1 n=1 Tax=Mycena indigotica TaxID=2126181 RepID=A0A8H6SDR5_9AGAR|nr:CUE domain-containing protein [Mycena indigotica]KAF7297083.1 CUE domain-containing protein [Mycena indigotica]